MLVHTGQSFDTNMSEVFFSELNIRLPDYRLEVKSDSLAEQMGKLFTGIETVISKEKPDRMLVLGDTNSAYACAFMAARMGVKVYHMEAGNRSFDRTMPEEINRGNIDHSSDIHLPYTERARANLLREGIASDKILVTGNPIYEVMQAVRERLSDKAFKELNLEPRKYILVTAHRQENVDNPRRLFEIIKTCAALKLNYRVPVIFSRHPRTKKRMEGFNGNGLTYHEPFGFLDFLTLEQNALCVLTDSGTVQEECCIYKVPCVTIRNNTERPETLECGGNILSGVDQDDIIRAVKVVLSQQADWQPPAEYLAPNVSDKIVRIVAGY